MSNMDRQLNEAIKTYANLSGMSETEILAAMAADADCQIARNIVLLMFAAA